MKSLVRTTFALLALTVAATGVAVAQQGPSIVYLDSDRLGAEAPSLQAARQQMQREMARIESQAEVELAPLQQEFQQLVQDFQQQQGMMTPERRQQQQQLLTQKQQELQRKGEQFERQAQEKQSEILGPALERINVVIDELRQERGYSFILDTASGAVISANPALDITTEVLRRLNAQG
jgi:outer membrane protein